MACDGTSFPSDDPSGEAGIERNGSVLALMPKRYVTDPVSVTDKYVGKALP